VPDVGGVSAVADACGAEGGAGTAVGAGAGAELGSAAGTSGQVAVPSDDAIGGFSASVPAAGLTRLISVQNEQVAPGGQGSAMPGHGGISGAVGADVVAGGASVSSGGVVAVVSDAVATA